MKPLLNVIKISVIIILDILFLRNLSNNIIDTSLSL